MSDEFSLQGRLCKSCGIDQNPISEKASVKERERERAESSTCKMFMSAISKNQVGEE